MMGVRLLLTIVQAGHKEAILLVDFNETLPCDWSVAHVYVSSEVISFFWEIAEAPLISILCSLPLCTA